MPCDAITIPQISLYPWKEGYHAPAPGYAHPAPHPAPHVVTPSPVHHAVYKPEPVYSLHHQPTPAPALCPPLPEVSVLDRAGCGWWLRINQEFQTR